MASNIKSKFLDPPYQLKLRDDATSVNITIDDLDAVSKKKFLQSRYLEISNKIQALSRRIPHMFDDTIDKYFTMCKELSDYVENPNIEAKSEKISVKLRKEGNAYFKSNDLENALEKYTMSIAFAPTTSPELLMAYANRSAVLFKAKWMTDCLVDIERALQPDYPDNLKAELLIRKASCYQALNPKNRVLISKTFAEARHWLEKVDEKNKAFMKKKLEKQEALQPTEKAICHKFDVDLAPPKLEAENTSMPGLSDAVKMQYSPEFGRHLVATRDIKPGEVIGVQKPYVNCVTLEMRYKVCWHCGKQTWSSIPCNSCSEVVYCSQKCRKSANREYHDVECWVIPRILAYGMVSGEFILTLRLTIKALKEHNNSIPTLIMTVNQIYAQPDPLKKGFVNGKLDPVKYSSIFCLSTNDTMNFARGTPVYLRSLLIAYFVTKKLKLGKFWKYDDLKVLKDDIWFIRFFQFIEYNDCLRLNNTLSNSLRFDNGEDPELEMISCGITPCFSYFNHSCLPMITRHMHSEHVIISAIVPIKKGEQVFDNYGTGYMSHDKDTRDAILSGQDFKCKCEACVNNWPPDTDNRELHDDEFCGAFNKIESLLDSIYKYARENNQVMDFSEERNIAIKRVEKYYRRPEINSWKAMRAVMLLQTYIISDQRPFLYLK